MASRPRRSNTVRFGAVLVLAASLLGPAGAGAAPPPTIDYLYVDANEGGASGGHAAIRFGDEVFHFEYRAPRTIRLRRDDFGSLLYRYTILDNRSLTLQGIPVSEETYRLLRDEFAGRFMVQDQHLRAQAAIAADRKLLAALLAHRAGREPEESVRLEGVGLFFDQARPPDTRGRTSGADDAGTTGATASALLSLRARVAEVYGEDFIDVAMARIRDQLMALTPPAEPDRPRDLSAERPPRSTYRFAARYQDLFVSLLALEALRDARLLRMDGVTGAAGDGPALDDADRELIGRLTDSLEASMVRLLRSSRPDWGFALLVGMARLAALDETRRVGVWMFLDAFPSDAQVISAAESRERPALTRALLDEARGDFAVARARLGAPAADRPGFPEADFVALEAAGNRLIEVSRAIDGQRSMRLGLGMRVPAREAILAQPIVPEVADEALARHAAAAREDEEAYESELRRLYGYNVVTRNCVTEIFRTIDAALGAARADADAEAIRRESTRRLGGHVDVEHRLMFIPAASAVAVGDTYAVAETIEVPSYRLAALGRMYRRDNAARVYLRESNTLSSTLYRRNPADSAFLFFTDDVVPPIRPLLGAVNIVAGLGVSAAGLFALPVDGGDLLRTGLKGVLFSLPELVFFNIRKGSLLFAPRPRESPASAP
jgi:hypothetical protein